MTHPQPGHDPGAETGPRQATPFTRVWYWAFLLVGLALVIGGLTPWEPAEAIADFPDADAVNLYGWVVDWSMVVPIVLGIFITAGSVLSLVGAQARNRIDESWAYERAGALVGSAGWLGYMLAVGIARPSSLIDSVFPLAAALSLLVRWVTLRKRERVVRVAYEASQENPQ